MSATSIQWTDTSWGVVRGCARISPGCEHCYAERMAHRFSGKGQPYEGLTVLGKHGPRWTGSARFVPGKLAEPLSWRKPKRVFVNSMSDLFHDDITDEQIGAVFGVMAATPHITYQVLTKRAERLPGWFEWAQMVGDGQDLLRCGMPSALLACAWEANCGGAWGNEEIPDRLAADASPTPGLYGKAWPLPNVHIGVSVENQDAANERLPHLLDHRVKAAVKWVSAEPLLEGVTLFAGDGPIDVPDGEASPLHWIVVGGESGPGARPCDVRWVRSIVDQCAMASVPCFTKQLGARCMTDDGGYTVHAGGTWPEGSRAHTGASIDAPRWMQFRDRAGGDPSEWPHDLRVRQFPESRP